MAPDLCSDCTERLAAARATVPVHWKVFRSHARRQIRGKLRERRPAANLSAAVAPVDRALAHTLLLDYAGDRPVSKRVTGTRLFWTCAVLQIFQLGDYCAFHQVDKHRGAYSAWKHSKGDIVVAVTPSLAEARTGDRFDTSLGTRRDFTVFFHRLVLNTKGALNFPSGFQYSEEGRDILIRYVKVCVQKLIANGAELSADIVEFSQEGN